MTVKYIRVSTIEQNTLRQEQNTSKFDSVFIDKVSGAIPFFERKEAKKIVEGVNGGDINEIHISSIDRMGRNIIDLLTVIEFFNNNNVNLFVENIGMYSMVGGKTNPTFKMIVSVLGNVAEMERSNMLERQKQGIAVAKANGTYKGRLYGSRMSDEDTLIKYKKVVKELESGESLRRSALIGGCSLGTAQKIKRIINN
jgi:DNA invertase Pin-like site-specific DNA recombinase